MSEVPQTRVDLPYDRRAPRAGVLERVAPGIRRFVMDNPGPFTFTGTCAYVLGEGAVAIVDPGPAGGSGLSRLLAALGPERVSHILVTHTHLDHSPAARELQEITGAPIWGAGPHRPARPPHGSEQLILDVSADAAHRPERVIADGERFEAGGLRLEAIATPGHTANHLCYAVEGGQTLLSGDHVMAWSTTVVAPPDGAMGPYLASLERLRARPETTYLPGHGEVLADAPRFVRALLHHRRQREASILTRLRVGDCRIADMVPALYEGLAPALVPAAALSIYAHLEDLVARGLAVTEGEPRLDGSYSVGAAGPSPDQMSR